MGKAHKHSCLDTGWEVCMLGSYTLNQLAEFHLAVADQNGGGGGKQKGQLPSPPSPLFNTLWLKYKKQFCVCTWLLAVPQTV